MCFLLHQSLSLFFITPRVDLPPTPRKCSQEHNLVWPLAERISVSLIQPKPRTRSNETAGSSSWSIYYRQFTFKKKNYYPLRIRLENEACEDPVPLGYTLGAAFLFTCVFINKAPHLMGGGASLPFSSFLFFSSPFPTCRASWSLQCFPHVYVQFPPTINSSFSGLGQHCEVSPCQKVG